MGSTRASLALLPMVIAGFLRLVTNRRVFIEPDSTEDAVTFVDALLDSPGVELQPCGEEWPILRAKLLARGRKGNEVTDAWIASATESCSFPQSPVTERLHAPGRRDGKRLTLRNNPKNVTAHAAIAMNTNPRGITWSAAIPTASASRNVQTVYIPSGKTAPQ